MNQLPLFPDTPSSEEAFAAFHEENPQVYLWLRDQALHLVRLGHRKRFGIRTLWEALRWQRLRTSCSDGEYKLNNNYTRFYARLLMENEPELAGLFQTRGD